MALAATCLAAFLVTFNMKGVCAGFNYWGSLFVVERSRPLWIIWLREVSSLM